MTKLEDISAATTTRTVDVLPRVVELLEDDRIANTPLTELCQAGSTGHSATLISLVCPRRASSTLASTQRPEKRYS